MRLNSFFKKTKKNIPDYALELIVLINELKLLQEHIHPSLREKYQTTASYMEEVAARESITKDDYTQALNQFTLLKEENANLLDRINTLLININMILNETKIYLNTNKFYPKPLLFKAQDLENIATEFKTYKVIQIHKYKTYKKNFDTYKSFFEETKELSTLLKEVYELKSDKLTAQLKNQLLILFQNGQFDEFKNKIEKNGLTN